MRYGRHLDGIKVLVAPSSFAVLDKTPLNRLAEAGCEVIANRFGRKLTKPELIGILKSGVHGVVAGLEALDREVLEGSRLRVISRCGSGLSNVDLQAAGELGIDVYSTPDAPTAAVAELTLGAMLSLLRMIPEMDRDLHCLKWTKKIGSQLEGKTVVIVGCGRIGRKVASLLGSFNVRIVAVDPGLSDAPPGTSLLPLQDALPCADLITLHSSGDRCILGSKELESIKPGAFVLNAARGGLIDEAALIAGLEDGRIAGAWLDTFEEEPYQGRLAQYPQVLLTPHVGSYTRECRVRMENEAVSNLIAAFTSDGSKDDGD